MVQSPNSKGGISSRGTEGGTPTHVLFVWDLPTRLFHWLVAGLVVAAYATWRLNWMSAHAQVGDVILVLTVFRVLWGFFGSETARFSTFLVWPWRAAAYVLRMFRREPDRQLSHNPAGGWMVVLLLVLLSVESSSGVVILNDIADQGRITPYMPPYMANMLTSLHAIVWNVLLGAIVVHILVIALYAAAKRQNLVGPMIGGSKRLPAFVSQPRTASLARAAALLAFSALVVVLCVRYV